MLALLLLAAAPEYVLLRPGATLLPPPGITTDAGTRRRACCDDGFGTMVVKLVADEGDLVQVETLGVAPARDVHCAATSWDDKAFLHQLRSYRLRAWVKRADVALVLRRAVRSRDVELAAGLPVTVLDGGVLHFGLFETTRDFELPVGDGAAGLSYLPARFVSREPPAARDGGTDLRLRLGTLASVGDGGAVSLLPGERWSKQSVDVRGSEASVLVEARCARLRVTVPKELLMEVPAAPRDSWGSTHLCEDSLELTVRVGAIISWPDGSVAGRTTAAEGMFARESRGVSNGRECFDVTLQGVEGSLPLCFRGEDLRPSDWKRARDAGSR